MLNDYWEVIGVAFQSLDGSEVENIGYVVPVDVVAHFLETVRKNGHFTGFCGLGIRYQPLENAALRQFWGMGAEQSGIMVSRSDRTGAAASVLCPHDVILSVDDVSIANDGIFLSRLTFHLSISASPFIFFIFFIFSAFQLSTFCVFHLHHPPSAAALSTQYVE